MPSRYTISAATAVMLVLLRLNIGWHFFSEGVKHWADPNWTSEPTLRAATGPLAPWYHAYLPEFHGFEERLHSDMTQTEQHAAQAWIDAIGHDWDVDRQRFSDHFGLNEKQQARAKAVLGEHRQQLRGWAASHRDELVAHVHQWRRRESAQQSPSAADVPFQKRRIADQRAALVADAGAWRSELAELERDYDIALGSLLDEHQRALHPLARPTNSVDLVDGMMTHFVLVVGVLLLLGLLTRLACLAGALFLLSVVMMQPFWVSDALPTYNQFVEMFALLALATTSVGRWAGLDFFVHRLLAGSNRHAKGPCDVFES